MDKTILLVDDDAKLRRLLKEFLEGFGFTLSTHSDGAAVPEKIRAESPDLVILDIMLPKKDGLEVLREIRSEFSLPVIMLTARGEDTDRIVGLELGADDYLPKPFNPRELLARIKAVMRRYGDRDEPSATEDRETRLSAGGLTLDLAGHTLAWEDNEIQLSSTEYKLMETFMSNPNTVLSRDQLMNAARGKDFMAFDRSIDVHVSKLRAKLSPYFKAQEKIKTVWGEGYMFIDGS